MGVELIGREWGELIRSGKETLSRGVRGTYQREEMREFIRGMGGPYQGVVIGGLIRGEGTYRGGGYFSCGVGFPNPTPNIIKFQINK